MDDGCPRSISSIFDLQVVFYCTQTQGENSCHEGPSRVLFRDVNAARSLKATRERATEGGGGGSGYSNSYPRYLRCNSNITSIHHTVPNGILRTVVGRPAPFRRRGGCQREECRTEGCERRERSPPRCRIMSQNVYIHGEMCVCVCA